MKNKLHKKISRLKLPVWITDLKRFDYLMDERDNVTGFDTNLLLLLVQPDKESQAIDHVGELMGIGVNLLQKLFSADINAIDRAGMSPKDYARKLGQKKMQEFLAEKGEWFSAYQEE